MRYPGIVKLAERLQRSPRLRKVVSTALLNAQVETVFRILSRFPDDPAHYGNAELRAGLRSEAERLGREPFVVTLFEEVYDYDGLTTYVRLLNSFSTAESAVQFLEKYLADYVGQVTSGDVGGDPWQVVDYKPRPYRWQPKGELTAKVLTTKSLAFRACEFNSRYAHFCVSGPYSGGAISEELIGFFGGRDELWSYFVDRGTPEEVSNILARIAINKAKKPR